MEGCASAAMGRGPVLVLGASSDGLFGARELDVGEYAVLALGAWDYLEELGYRDAMVAVAYQRLLRLQARQKEEPFQACMVSQLRSQLYTKKERLHQQFDGRRCMHEMLRSSIFGTGGWRSSHSLWGRGIAAEGFLVGRHDRGWRHEGGVLAVQCDVRLLSIPDKVRQAILLLLRELSKELVLVAVERLNPGSALG